MKRVFILLFLLYSCTAKDKTTETENKKQLNFLLIFAHYRETGNCIRTEKKEETVQTFCSRLPNRLCNPNLELYTEGKRTKRLSDFSSILETHPICKNLIGVSGLLSEQLTTEEEKQKILIEKTWNGVESCESSGFQISPELFSKEEALFLLSDRGRLGIVLENYRILKPSPFFTNPLIQEAQDCMEKVFVNTEKEILSKNKNQEKQIWVKK